MPSPHAAIYDTIGTIYGEAVKRSPIKRNPEKIAEWLRKSRANQKPLKRTAIARSVVPLAKKAKRKPSWVVVDGVRIFLKTGREVCITDAAWTRRRVECANHYFAICQCGCEMVFAVRGARFDCHHLYGRGRGRDDRIMVDGKPNLVPLLHDHHMEEHNQGWSKGELHWSPKETK